MTCQMLLPPSRHRDKLRQRWLQVSGRPQFAHYNEAKPGSKDMRTHTEALVWVAGPLGCF